MLEFNDTEKLNRFNLLQQVAARCPIGWHQQQLVWSRQTSQEDIIQWLCDVLNLIGTDADGGSEELERIRNRYQSTSSPQQST